MLLILYDQIKYFHNNEELQFQHDEEFQFCQ